MKKKLAALLTAVMVLGSATTALAAPSVSAGDLSNDKGNITKVESMTDAKAEELAGQLVIKSESITKSDNVTSVKTEKVSASVVKSAAKKAIEVVEQLFKVDLDKKVNKGETKTTAALVAVMDVTVEGEVSADKPATLTFTVPEAKASENYIILHRLADGTWETIPATVAKGTVTGTFTSFSPVAIVKVAATTETTGVVSVLPIIAAAGLVGTVACGKKVKFN